MKKVLFVNACVRPQSRTFALARQVLEKLGGEITEVSLCRENLAPLDWAQLERRNKLLAEQDFSAPMFRHAGPDLPRRMRLSLRRPTGIWPFQPACGFILNM